jgi:rod shape-determining protein MreB
VKSRVVICVPSGVTEVEKRAVRDAALSSGARSVFLIDEPMASAVGSGLPVEEPRGSMIVDVGGGTTDIAVISLGGIVTSKSLRIAGDAIDEHIVYYIRREYSLAIGERTAEEIKTRVGCVFEPDFKHETSIRGRDLVSGLPKTIVINAKEIAGAISEPVNSILDAIKFTLERTPPELASDIIETGIMLTGGGALLGGLDRLIEAETGIPVVIADHPLDCVARGAGIVLENINALKGILMSS